MTRAAHGVDDARPAFTESSHDGASLRSFGKACMQLAMLLQ